MAKAQSSYPASIDGRTKVDRSSGDVVTSDSYDIIEDTLFEVEKFVGVSSASAASTVWGGSRLAWRHAARHEPGESDAITNICRIATGTYTGDGSASQGITGVGFQPKALLINLRAAGGGVAIYAQYLKLDQSWGDNCIYHATDGQFYSLGDRINSLDADGFTVDDAGTDAHPNATDQVYDYVAFG